VINCQVGIGVRCVGPEHGFSYARLEHTITIMPEDESRSNEQSSTMKPPLMLLLIGPRSKGHAGGSRPNCLAPIMRCTYSIHWDPARLASSQGPSEECKHVNHNVGKPRTSLAHCQFHMHSCFLLRAPELRTHDEHCCGLVVS
jgi:hypothetical protein